MIRLSKSQSEYLLSRPESGMGFQLVEATLRGNNKHDCIIFNADMLSFLNEDFDAIYKSASRRYLAEFSDLEKSLSSDDIIRLEVVTPLYKAASFSECTGADKAPIAYSRKYEIFKRFSAFANDRRVTPDKGLLPGTYATTEDDASYVNRGMDAVARYALPDSRPAIYIFTIRPPEYTEIRRGVVEPANGQRGGGKEVIFVKGSPANTVTGPSTIPS